LNQEWEPEMVVEPENLSFKTPKELQNDLQASA
jgi:hypothetical protein